MEHTRWTTRCATAGGSNPPLWSYLGTAPSDGGLSAPQARGRHGRNSRQDAHVDTASSPHGRGLRGSRMQRPFWNIRKTRTHITQAG
jgi:hypothetical protein